MSSKTLIKKTRLGLLPSDVLIIIFEFEGFAKENTNKFLKQFKQILKSQKYYSFAFRSSYHDDYDYGPRICSVPLLNIKENYKYLLNYKKAISFCNCETPCCYQFHYNRKISYNCGCHEKKPGGVSYIYCLDRTGDKKITIRVEKTGFCVKIT
jgi:hypothetical protein